MTKRPAYFTKTLSTGKVAVYRANGNLITKFSNQRSADHHIARQVAEDAEWRTAKVAGYLADRKARPAPVIVPSNQIEMF